MIRLSSAPRRPVFDANATTSGGEFGDLPEWDLSDLYTDEDAPELHRDMAWISQAGKDFAGYL